ncbi:hypothetical protein COLO4_38363 [Corchorus olitorius]|uniref:Uncharacterized protein n=1 Tax=Corchorus olitorius TaxID=93759 RepID=A0A1R3FVE0_9ROSI|nr:hypothetical protein COLO4_38363 [Corchorus olitorius]
MKKKLVQFGVVDGTAVATLANKARWWSLISGSFLTIFKNVVRFYIDQKGIYDPKWLVVFEHDFSVKLLPENHAKTLTDVKMFKTFMCEMIYLPFALTSVDKDNVRDDFELPQDLITFIENLNNVNLTHVSYEFLLSAPFVWNWEEKMRGLLNAQELLTRQQINQTDLDTFSVKGLMHGQLKVHRWSNPIRASFFTYDGSDTFFLSFSNNIRCFGCFTFSDEHSSIIDEHVIAFEKVQAIRSFFAKKLEKVNEWKTNPQEVLATPTIKAKWWSLISDSFPKIFKNVVRFYIDQKGIIDPKWLVISDYANSNNDFSVKLLP